MNKRSHGGKERENNKMEDVRGKGRHRIRDWIFRWWRMLDIGVSFFLFNKDRGRKSGIGISDSVISLYAIS